MSNIIIIGSGGREHAITKALHRTTQTPINITYYSTNENPAMSRMTYPNKPIIVPNFELETLNNNIKLILSLVPEYVIIGPELPLEQGFTDFIESYNISVIGPTKENAQIETSKQYCRDLLKTHAELSLIQPKYKHFKATQTAKAMDYIENTLNTLNTGYVIKQDGLCGGKGVKVSGDHLKTLEETRRHLETIRTDFLVEEKLVGEEFSLISLTDGINSIHFPPVQDFKRLNNSNTGPNTGSMGSYTLEDHTLPFLTNADIHVCKTINDKTLKLMNDTHNQIYKGFLYGSYMKTTSGIKLIEYNARLGDPESINLMELLDTDLHELFRKTVNHELSYYRNKTTQIFKSHATVCKYLVPKGYPTNPIKNFPIQLSTNIPASSLIYASIKQVTNHHGETYYEGLGSRTLAIITSDKTLKLASENAEYYASEVSGDLHYRTDIGTILSTQSLQSTKTEYEKSGVSIDEGNKVVMSIKDLVESTYTKETLSNFGDFGGLYKIDKTRILVASTDGVGTKTEHLRKILNSDPKLLYNTLGQDIVNHCVNDILVKNARPLFFLDYFATSELSYQNVKYMVEGISKACRATNTVLLGGETAEMPSVYTKASFDIAGTIVGETSTADIFDGKQSVTTDTLIYYLPSSGPHTNGYSLIRYIYNKLTRENITSEEAVYLNRFTTQPHRCYLKEIQLLEDSNIVPKALCHITGGGLIDNPERVISSSLKTILETKQILKNMPKGFKMLQKYGEISDIEMLRVFNCGVGLLVYLSPSDIKQAQKVLPELKPIGYISQRQ